MIPIHKGGSKYDIGNFRPITVLSVFSKTFEKLICSRLMSFINKHGLLPQSQYGFRAKRSTEFAILDVLTKIIAAIENKQFSVRVFLDLSKAFDTVNHDILICKLEHYGVRGLALDWFRSYLSCRRQFVSFNTHNSLDQFISCGVPQGSVLGPLLFIIYINDICNSSDIISFCLFADDTSLLYNHQNVDIAIHNLNIELVKINNWLLSNKLSINLLKTNYIIFCARQHKYTRTVPLSLNGTVLNQVQTTKFLGVCIDENISWNNHVNILCSKICKNVGVMNRLKYFVPKNILLTLYNSIILPYLNYAILTWGSTTLYLNKLFMLQKKAVRIINNAGYLDHTTPLFRNINILKLSDLYYFNLGKFMLKYTRDSLPHNFDSLFILNSSVHSHDTRSSSRGDFFVKQNRTSYFKNSIFQRGVLYWNSLSTKLKQSVTVSSFTRELKNVLLNHTRRDIFIF